jgi:hypothetical protein
VSRFEPVLVGLFLAAWMVDLLAVLGIVDLRGSLELGLYPLYSTAAAAGWVAGNIYVARGRRLPLPLRRRIRLVYLLGPPGVLFLLRAMASAEAQRAAPLVPLYSFGVFSVFFLVPVLVPRAPRRRSFRVGDPDPDRDRRGVNDRDGDPPVVP